MQMQRESESALVGRKPLRKIDLFKKCLIERVVFLFIARIDTWVDNFYNLALSATRVFFLRGFSA